MRDRSSVGSKTRVLHVINNLARGGAEQLLLNTIRHADRSRFDVGVVYLDGGRDALLREFADLGCPVHCLNGRSVGWLHRFRQLVRARSIDVVHAHLPYAAIGARLALPRAGPPIVYTEHGMWDFYRDHNRMTYWGNVLTFGRNRNVVTVSESVRKSLRYPAVARLMRMPLARTIYHGVDLTAVKRWAKDGEKVRRELDIPQEAVVVGCVANFRQVKGHVYLLDALAQTRRSVPDIRLVLVGQGETEPAIRQRVRDLGLADVVSFTGQKQHGAEVVGAFDLFVLPSLNEALPIALIEAIALGKPVVATDVGGIPEVVTDGVHGFVVPPADAGALAEAISRLAVSGVLRERFGQAAERRALDFDIRSTVRALERTYSEVIRA